jgi:hypothetical protein
VYLNVIRYKDRIFLPAYTPSPYLASLYY